MASFLSLPNELIYHISLFCEEYSFFLAQTSKLVREIVKPVSVLAAANRVVLNDNEDLLVYCNIDDFTGKAIAEGGYLALLDFLKLTKQEQAILAAYVGNVSLLRQLEGEHDKLTTLYAAVRGEKLNCIKYLLREDFKEAVRLSLDIPALELGKIEILNWCLEQGTPLDEELFSHAGSAAMVDYLLSLNCPWDERAANHAAEEGRVEVLQRLRELNAPIDYESVQIRAAKEGKVEVIKWVNRLDITSLPWLTIAAATGGKLETIQWLLNQGHSWYKETSEFAARKGHTHILDYAKEKGYIYENIYYHAIRYDEEDVNTIDEVLKVLEWGKREGIPLNATLYKSALERNSSEIIKWLEENKCPRD